MKNTATSLSLASLADDETLLNYAVPTMQTIWHSVSTVCMSPMNAIWGVVNSRMRVRKLMGV